MFVHPLIQHLLSVNRVLDIFIDFGYIMGAKVDLWSHTDSSLVGWETFSQGASERFSSRVGRKDNQKWALVHCSGQLNRGVSIKQLGLLIPPPSIQEQSNTFPYLNWKLRKLFLNKVLNLPQRVFIGKMGLKWDLSWR